MVDGAWNFRFLPPDHGDYSRDETIDMLIHSTRAAQNCQEQQNTFVACRSGPYGKVVEPGACQAAAENMISCFNTTTQVPEPCAAAFSEVKTCLSGKWKTSGHPKCANLMQNYLNCEKP